ncbi:MAG TPA: hypothetical protein VL359_03025, partial [bacterium]|nr:hypothetical protein [bacterium]
DIYILSAVPELVNFTFHLGDQGLTELERMVALSVAQNRLGLEMHPQPSGAHSVGLFAQPGSPPLATLYNEPQLVSRAYTALLSMQVERLVRRAVDHKINYLQSNFGESFFEVIYQSVVERNDLPLSRHQLAWVVQRRSLLGNLTARGWKPEQEDELRDDFVHLDEARPAGAAQPDFSGFGERLAKLGREFTQLLAELQASAKADPRPENPHTLLWNLYRRGIYNLSRPEAREAFRGSVFYGYLKDLIAQISSENYSAFTREIQQEGVRIYVHRPFYYLLEVGSRFSFLIGETVVRYHVLAAPVQEVEGLDPLSKVFCENLVTRFGAAQPAADVAALKLLGEQVQRCNQLWWDYSRHLAFALVDRVLTATIIANLQPGGIAPKNLWYLPDEQKLCLGPAVLTSDLVPFQKILQTPENMGSIQKNPRTASTTIDDFAIEAHRIQRLKAELENISSIAEDVLDILQNLTHSKMDAALVQRYEQGLEQLLKVLAMPLRHCTEREVQRLHQLGQSLKENLQAFYKSPGSHREHLINLLQAQLRNRRSDGHQLRLNFTDQFILAKTEIKVLQKVKTESGETVARQKKVEVEVDQAYQTLATRMRDAIHLHELLRTKRYVVFSPEGQKKKQVEYVLEIIGTLQDLRGSAITFYCDLGMLDEAQVQQLATRVKPHNFFKMDDLRPEQPPGMTGAPVRDTLSGRLVPGAQAEAAPAAPAPSAQADAAPSIPIPTGALRDDTVFTNALHPEVRYRLDQESGQFTYLESGASPVPARTFPVDLGNGQKARILMARLANGRYVFHGLYGNEVLMPASKKPQPPLICIFEFPERTVRVVNEGGKPVVRVDAVQDEFLEELRSIN